MVDTALGCPEKGIVNFNVLHSLLHQILDHLGNGKTLEKDVESGYGGFSGEEVNKGNVQETTNCEQRAGEAGGGKVDEHSRSSR